MSFPSALNGSAANHYAFVTLFRSAELHPILGLPGAQPKRFMRLWFRPCAVEILADTDATGAGEALAFLSRR